jgi:hypothetical protein
MFLNELSLVPMASDAIDGRNRVLAFIFTMKAAASRGVQSVLRLPDSFYNHPIAPNYNWHDCLNDGEIEIEARRYFKSLVTKGAFISDVPHLQEQLLAIDCFWRDKSAFGLKAAYIAEGLALSFRSSDEWDVHLVNCKVHEIEKDGEILPRHVSIHHASTSTHLDAHASWIQLLNRQEVRNGRDLWDLRKSFFPCLIWCDAVENQLEDIPTTALASIIRGLAQLNTFCTEWKSGAFDPELIGCAVTPESQSTLRMYGAERTFICPDGGKRTFSWKAKVGNSRIYFDPETGPGQILIGYIGKHLRTVKYR